MTFENSIAFFIIITLVYAILLVNRQRLPEVAFNQLSALYCRVAFWMFVYHLFVSAFVRLLFAVTK